MTRPGTWHSPTKTLVSWGLKRGQGKTLQSKEEVMPELPPVLAPRHIKGGAGGSVVHQVTDAGNDDLKQKEGNA